MTIEFVDPWVAVRDHADKLVDELKREVTEHHTLWNRKVRAIGQRTDCDDVLFEVEGSVPSYAVIHLTWRGQPEDNLQFPVTKLFSSITDWFRDGMLNDHREFIGRHK